MLLWGENDQPQESFQLKLRASFIIHIGNAENT
jgi:hypothetical protein